MTDTSAEEVLEGTIEKILYEDETSGFGVVLLEPAIGRGAVVAAGQISRPIAGQTFRFHGEWHEHPRFGRQLKVSTMIPVTPETEDGIRRYLASGRFSGIGTATAGKIVDALGPKTFDTLLSDDSDVRVEGIGKKKLKKLRAALREERARIDAMVFLASLGLTPRLSQAILDRYGATTIDVVRRDPYLLCQTVDGIGFQTADRIAGAVGITGNHPKRIRAGVAYVIELGREQGHVCLPRNVATQRAAAVLQADIGDVEDGIDAALQAALLIEDDAPDGTELLYLPVLHRAEVFVAGCLLRSEGRRPILRDGEMLYWDFPAMLSDEQRDAVMLLLRSPVAVLTGGPGVGKTTVLKAFVNAARSVKRKVELCAPTGRAARRLEEATNHSASTIHRLLRIAPNAVAVERPPEEIRADALVIDEASMLDLPLFARVLEALPSHASLILVGDKDQLPSIGPGDVLNDLIASGVVPVARLTRIYRQESHGLIVRNAHRVLAGDPPVFPPPGDDSDFYFMERNSPEDAAQLIRDLVATRLPGHFGVNPREDIQVLCPMHRGAAGTDAINDLLQDTLNGDKPGARKGDRRLRVGDRVIFTRNDYDKSLSNGDLGQVVGINPESGVVDIVFGHEPHTFREWKDLSLAFALTVHKAQGSEYPVVIIPLFTEQRIMLRRSLVYTAMTRAKKLLIIVGQKAALAMAIEESRRWSRWTLLRSRLGASIATLDEDASEPVDD